MKRFAVAIAILGLLGAQALPAGAAKTRTEKFEYRAFGAIDLGDYGTWVGNACFGGTCTGGSVTYKTSKRDKAISITIADQSGATVRGAVWHDGTSTPFCGSLDRLPIEGGKAIQIWIAANPCAATPDGGPTTGTVTTKFLRK